MIKKLAAFALCLSVAVLAGCGIFVSDEKVEKAVEKQGYSSVHIDSKHIFFVNWRGCSKEDDACYKLSAINANGQEVDIIACAGWPFKGVTVRAK